MTLLRWIAIVGGAAIVVACGEASPDAMPEPLVCEGVALASLTPSTGSLNAGDTLRVSSAFHFGACNDTTTDSRARFSTSSTAIATIDTSGLVTARGAGTVTILATSIVDANAKAPGIFVVR